MTALARAATDVAKFKVREKKVEYRPQLKVSLSEDLELIARVRTAVNAQAGDGTKISVTEMIVEECTELRDEQFVEWGGKPETPEAEQKLIERLVAEYDPSAPKKKHSR